MKHILTILLAAMTIATIGTHQQAYAENVERVISSEPTTYEPTSEVYYSAIYTGTIGKSLGVTVYLEHHYEGVYTGWYYYNKYGPNNKLTLNGYTRNGRIIIEEYTAQHQNTGCFEGVFNDYGVFVGTMYVYKNGKEYSVTLYPQY